MLFSLHCPKHFLFCLPVSSCTVKAQRNGNSLGDNPSFGDYCLRIMRNATFHQLSQIFLETSLTLHCFFIFPVRNHCIPIPKFLYHNPAPCTLSPIDKTHLLFFIPQYFLNKCYVLVCVPCTEYPLFCPPLLSLSFLPYISQLLKTGLPSFLSFSFPSVSS